MAAILLFSQTLSLSARPSTPLLASIDESLLVLDESAFDEAMQELNALDEYLETNEGITFADLESTESELIINMDKSTAPLGMSSENEPPLGIPSFLWGCVFGILGVLLVYIMTDGDKEEVKKSLWGFLVAIGVYVIVYVGFWGVIWSY